MTRRRGWSGRALEAFAVWFASKGGVYQTTIVVLGWSVLAWVHRSLDPNLFRTMAVLTIYSAVTQPVLAYCNAVVARQADRDAAEMRGMEHEALGELHELSKATHELVRQIHANRG